MNSTHTFTRGSEGGGVGPGPLGRWDSNLFRGRNFVCAGKGVRWSGRVSGVRVDLGVGVGMG